MEERTKTMKKDYTISVSKETAATIVNAIHSMWHAITDTAAERPEEEAKQLLAEGMTLFYALKELEPWLDRLITEGEYD